MYNKIRNKYPRIETLHSDFFFIWKFKYYPRNVSRDLRRWLWGVPCCDTALPSEAHADCDPLVGSNLGFRYLSHFCTPRDTKQRTSQVRASPSKHRTNAVKKSNYFSDKPAATRKRGRVCKKGACVSRSQICCVPLVTKTLSWRASIVLVPRRETNKSENVCVCNY